ncbi:FemAB family XrtA/PEP-CTERM system-associated protein [Kordiimonas sp.]|uniref:FemAB family XrtA/PEP-CTERM system-associated protein n=1 Tax=Kordiimonas sp. TaxID=1970157 RepID=UPI003A8F1295
MAVTVSRLERSTTATWDRYVAQHAQGTFCHLSGWKFAVEAGAGHDCPFLMAEEAGEVVGVMPLTIRRSMLFGTSAISNMFGVYGGSVTSHGEARQALDTAAWKLAGQAGAKVLESRTQKPQHSGEPGWVSAGAKAATFIREIPAGEGDEVLLSVPRKQRAVVRKSLGRGLRCDWSPRLRDVYNLYAVSVHQLGTPVFPFALFEALATEFPDNHICQLIRAPDGTAVASLFSFYDHETILPYYAGGSPAARGYGAHDFMYYQLMLWARDQGLKYYDFGRSKIGTGPYSFKKNWGFEPTLLEYEHRLADGALAPDLSPQNKKFAVMSKVWKKLPLGVANRLGPVIARHLG